MDEAAVDLMVPLQMDIDITDWRTKSGSHMDMMIAVIEQFKQCIHTQIADTTSFMAILYVMASVPVKASARVDVSK